MGYMYGGTILRIDLCSGTIDREPTANYTKLWLGGRGLNSRILYTETDPTVKPLDPANVLMFSLGPFTGTMVPGSGRVERINARIGFPIKNLGIQSPSTEPIFGVIRGRFFDNLA